MQTQGNYEYYDLSAIIRRERLLVSMEHLLTLCHQAGLLVRFRNDVPHILTDNYDQAISAIRSMLVISKTAALRDAEQLQLDDLRQASQTVRSNAPVVSRSRRQWRRRALLAMTVSLLALFLILLICLLKAGH